MQKVKAEIHLNNLRHNAESFSKLTKTKLCAVVKANAYGHGAEEVANALAGIADFFAVALIEEAIAIRSAVCGKKILVFTPPTEAEEAYALAINGFIASVSDLHTAKLLSAVCKRYGLSLDVHLKVNTGMNRYGMGLAELNEVCAFLKTQSYVHVRGIYSHLCECSYVRAEKQRAMFEEFQKACKVHYPHVTAHLSATYGALLGERFAYDAVRVGIGLYGYLPCAPSAFSGIKQEVVKTLALQKCMRVWAKTTAVRTCTFGGVGYGAECQNGRVFDVSVLRFGYADGFLRKRENGTNGSEKNANTLCMDVCIREQMSNLGEWTPIMTDAEKTALLTQTISYEVLCAATRRAEYVYDSEKLPLCGTGSKNAEGTETRTSGIYEKTTE